MFTPSWARTILESRGIRFTELHHPEANTSQELAHIEHVSGHRVAKVVVALADGRPVELVLPASRHVNLGLLRIALKAEEVRLASEEEMARYFPECEVGAVAPLRLWDAPVVMDRSLSSEGDIIIRAGTRTDAIRLNFRDWYDLVKPQTAAFTEPLEPATA